MPRHLRSVKTKNLGAGRGWCWLLGKRQAAGVMLDPVGDGVRVKGFDAEALETVPQLAGVLVMTMQPGMMRFFNGIPSVNGLITNRRMKQLTWRVTHWWGR